MKKLILLIIIFTSILTTSCTKDEKDDSISPENISGTTWKCTSGTDWFEDLEYALLIFTSTSTAQGWTKEIDELEQKDFDGSFTISNNQIFISHEDGSVTGIIDGGNMTTIIDGETYVFIKQ
jgi:hypothetical protein